MADIKYVPAYSEEKRRDTTMQAIEVTAATAEGRGVISKILSNYEKNVEDDSSQEG